MMCCKKIRELDMVMKKVEMSEDLLKMDKAVYAKEMQEKQLIQWKKTLAVE